MSSKIGVLRSLVGKADVLCIGGGMANTFLAAGGTDIKASLSEPERENDARDILSAAAARGVEILLPVDMRWSGDRILDIGEETEREFAAHIAEAGAVFWNGPMGLFEQPAFAHGTEAIAQAMAATAAATVVGGG